MFNSKGVNFKAISSNNKGFIGEALVLGVVLVVAGAAFWLYRNQSTPKQNEVVEEISLPSDAVQISGCVPFEGEHWVRVQDLPHGPIYVVDKGKIVALDYMYRPDEFPGEAVAKMAPAELGAYMQEKNYSVADLVKEAFGGNTPGVSNFVSMPNVPFKSFDIHWTAPHPGILEPHIDIHFFMNTAAEREQVCPDADLEQIAPASLITRLQELGVPVPGAP